MSTAIRCDYCGDLIEGGRKDHIVLSAGEGSPWGVGIGDFHASECWPKVNDAIDVAIASGSAIESIPTLPAAAPIEQKRDRRSTVARMKSAGFRFSADTELFHLGIRPEPLRRLRAEGLRTLADVAALTPRRLAAIDGVGPSTQADLLFAVDAAGLAMTEGEPPASELGSRIRELRYHRGLSTREVADRIGVRQPVVSAIELGRRAPTDGEIKALSELFETTADALLSSSQKAGA